MRLKIDAIIAGTAVMSADFTDKEKDINKTATFCSCLGITDNANLYSKLTT